MTGIILLYAMLAGPAGFSDSASQKIYSCKDSSDHTYSLIEKTPTQFVLLIDNGHTVDESDLTVSGSEIINIESHGGIGKYAEAEKLFHLLSPWPRKMDKQETQACPFSYEYRLSP